MNDKRRNRHPFGIQPQQAGPHAVLREELAAAGLCHGVERVEDLAEELVRRYVLRLDGLNVYVRNERVLERERVAKEIRASFDGCNAWELAGRFGLSVRQVQRLFLNGKYKIHRIVKRTLLCVRDYMKIMCA